MISRRGLFGFMAAAPVALPAAVAAIATSQAAARASEAERSLLAYYKNLASSLRINERMGVLLPSDIRMSGFPIIPVEFEPDKFFVFSKDDFGRDDQP